MDFGPRLLVAAPMLGCTACILPVDLDVAVPVRATGQVLRDGYSEIGAGLGVDLRPASRGLVVGVGGDASTAASVDGVLLRGVLSAGYAVVPRPFEGHWGWAVLGLGGYETVPLLQGIRGAPLLGARASIAYRISASHEVWNEDIAPTTEYFLTLGGESLGLVPVTGDDHRPRLEVSVLAGLAVSFYSNGAP